VNVRGRVPHIVVNNLAMREQIRAAEDNFSGDIPAVRSVVDHQDFVVWLLQRPFLVFRVRHLLHIALHDSTFRLRVNRRDEEGVVDVLRAQVFQRLLRIRSCDVIAPLNESVLGWNPQFEFFAVAHKIKSFGADNRQQANHSQHGRLSRKHITANLLVVGNSAFFRAAHCGVNVHRGLHGLNLSCLSVDVVDQFRLGSGF